MKKVFSQIEYLMLLVFVVLSFFPWMGLLNRSGIDITKSVLENITSLASIDEYAITVTVLVSAIALILALLQKAVALLPTIAFSAPLVAFIYGMIDTSGDYLSSMALAYIIVVVLSLLMVLRQFGIIKFNIKLK